MQMPGFNELRAGVTVKLESRVGGCALPNLANMDKYFVKMHIIDK